MMMKTKRSWIETLLHHGMGIVLALGLLGAATAHALTVKVSPDNATLIRVAGLPASVVIGNPLFADALVVNNSVLVQGRNFGKTNVIVLDADGRRLAQFDVVVAPDSRDEIALYKGGERNILLCAPECAPVADVRAAKKAFEDLNANMTARHALIGQALGK